MHILWNMELQAVCGLTQWHLVWLLHSEFCLLGLRLLTCVAVHSISEGLVTVSCVQLVISHQSVLVSTYCHLVVQSVKAYKPTVLENTKKKEKKRKNYLCTDILLSLWLSRMRNLPITPLQIPLLLLVTMTRKLAHSSVGVLTPSAIHLWRNASPSRVSLPNRLLYADNSLLTQNCWGAGNSTHTHIILWIWGCKEWSMHFLF